MTWWDCPRCHALNELAPATPALTCAGCRHQFALVDVGNAGALASVFGPDPQMPDYAPVIVDLGKKQKQETARKWPPDRPA